MNREERMEHHPFRTSDHPADAQHPRHAPGASGPASGYASASGWTEPGGHYGGGTHGGRGGEGGTGYSSGGYSAQGIAGQGYAGYGPFGYGPGAQSPPFQGGPQAHAPQGHQHEPQAPHQHALQGHPQDRWPIWPIREQQAPYGSQGYGSQGFASPGQGHPAAYPQRQSSPQQHGYGGANYGSEAYGGWESPQSLQREAQRAPAQQHQLPRQRRGPKGYTRSDQRLMEEICDRLVQQVEIDPGDMEVSVRDGIVELSGHIASRADKHHVEDIVDSVWGVKDIRNNLRIGRPEDGDINTNRAPAAEGDAAT